MTGTQETDVPFVSLIVVAHGEVAHVGKCLESLRVQDYPQARREFILVHSDCSDGTREALAAWRRGPGADESVTILANPKRTLGDWMERRPWRGQRRCNYSAGRPLPQAGTNVPKTEH